MPSRALSAPSILRPPQEHDSHLRGTFGTGTFLTDTSLEELENDRHANSEKSRLAHRISQLSEKAAELSHMTSSLARQTSKARHCQAIKASAALVSFPRSKSAPSSSGRCLHSKERLLQKALFLHKEPDYYDCLPVKPGSLWFRALYQQVSVHDSRVGKKLLSTLDVGLVETLCFVNCKCLLVYSADRGVEVCVSDTAAAEFKRLALTWSHACGGPQGDPVVVLKKRIKGYKNTCEPLNYAELEAALLRVSGEDEIVVFQRFVRGRNEPSLLRIAWRDSLSPYGFRLKSTLNPDQLRCTDKKVHWTVSSDIPGIQATELKSIPTRVTHIIEQLAHFTQMVFGMQLSQLVVDVLQDEDGHYHMCQVKAFTAQPRWLRLLRSNRDAVADAWQDDLRNRSGSSGTGKSSARKSKKVVVPSSSCAMCTCTRPLSQLKKRMTPKMMLETEHHMRKRGVQLFHIARLRTMQLSDPCPVCEACWSLYLAEAELCRAEAKLAKAVGIDLEGQMADESYVPFGGVLSSVRSGRTQADFGGVHKRRDPFRIHDPLLEPSPPQIGQATVSDDGHSRADANIEWPQLLRRGGEALEYREDVGVLPVAKPVPSSVRQWRLMIHLNRLMDLAPEMIGNQKKLTLRVQVPWQQEKPHDYQIPAISSQADIRIHCTAVHFVFTDAISHHPLHQFLSESLLHFSLLGEAAPSSGQDSTQSPATPKLMSGELSLARMLDSNPDGFLAQTWVMMCRQGEGAIQCQLKLTLGLVCDHTVSTEYVALRSYADAFVPCREYFASEALPMTWVASILGEKPSVPGGAAEYGASVEADRRSPTPSQRRRTLSQQRALTRSASIPMQTPPPQQNSTMREPPVLLSVSSSGCFPAETSQRSASPQPRREPEFEAEPDEAADEAMIDEVVDGLNRLSDIARVVHAQ
mmetsp:Transcript_122669/g.192519  ORF Transcript_122669/g.192519 Transcript_122669/m.192519 type:complete len:919 (-) Transcript_122669:89-2845(-)